LRSDRHRDTGEQIRRVKCPDLIANGAGVGLQVFQLNVDAGNAESRFVERVPGRARVADAGELHAVVARGADAVEYVR